MTTLLLCLTALISGSDQLPESPQITAEHAARLYRIQVYETYRLTREEYNLRRAVGDQLWRAFEKSSQDPERRAEVVAWFAAARDASLPKGVDQLPPLPEFASSAQFADEEEAGVPVTTSAPEDKILIEPSGAATSLHIELPKQAVQVGPTRFFSRLVRTAFAVWSGDTETDTSAPAPQPNSEPAAKPVVEPTHGPALKPAAATPPTAAHGSEPGHTPGLNAPQSK